MYLLKCDNVVLLYKENSISIFISGDNWYQSNELVLYKIN